jgi:hypothetical protein
MVLCLLLGLAAPAPAHAVSPAACGETLETIQQSAQIAGIRSAAEALLKCEAATCRLDHVARQVNRIVLARAALRAADVANTFSPFPKLGLLVSAIARLGLTYFQDKAADPIYLDPRTFGMPDGPTTSLAWVKNAVEELRVRLIDLERQSARAGRDPGPFVELRNAFEREIGEGFEKRSEVGVDPDWQFSVGAFNLSLDYLILDTFQTSGPSGQAALTAMTFLQSVRVLQGIAQERRKILNEIQRIQAARQVLLQGISGLLQNPEPN